MKGARLIVPGCKGFFTPEPEAFGILTVEAIEHYKVKCVMPDGSPIWIPIREFEILEWPTNGSGNSQPDELV